MVKNLGQMKIQQMAFMIIAVFIFFVLVGLFFLRFQLRDIGSEVLDLNREKAISSLAVISNLPEFNCMDSRGLCLDEDKLKVMSGTLGENYKDFWPVASIEVYKIYPEFEEVISCPEENCNYYEIFDNGQTNNEKHSTFVNLCKRIKESGYVYDSCEIAKLVVGVKINE